MGDSYNATEEYQKFAYGQYCEFRGALEGALKNAGDKPVLLIIARPSGNNVCNWAFNMASADADEKYQEGAAYSYLAAAKASEDLVGKSDMVLSLQIEPDSKWYAIKNMRQEVEGIRRSLQPFIYDIAGYMGLRRYRVSYSDVAFRETKDVQERGKAEIKDINEIGSLTGDRQPKVVVQFVDSERLGMLHGHSYENLIENGGDLRRCDAKSPFGAVFGAVLSYNVGLNCNGFGRDRQALLYASDPMNAKPIVLPGKLPENFRIEDVVAAVERASDSFKMAQEGGGGANPTHQITESAVGSTTMKL